MTGWLKLNPLLLRKFLWGKIHTILNESTPSPSNTGKQTFLLEQCAACVRRVFGVHSPCMWSTCSVFAVFLRRVRELYVWCAHSVIAACSQLACSVLTKCVRCASGLRAWGVLAVCMRRAFMHAALCVYNNHNGVVVSRAAFYSEGWWFNPCIHIASTIDIKSPIEMSVLCNVKNLIENRFYGISASALPYSSYRV